MNVRPDERAESARTGSVDVIIHEIQSTDARIAAADFEEPVSGNPPWHYVVTGNGAYQIISEDQSAGHDCPCRSRAVLIAVCTDAPDKFERAVRDACKLAADILYRHGMTNIHTSLRLGADRSDSPEMLRPEGVWERFLEDAKASLEDIRAGKTLVEYHPENSRIECQPENPRHLTSREIIPVDGALLDDLDIVSEIAQNEQIGKAMLEEAKHPLLAALKPIGVAQENEQSDPTDHPEDLDRPEYPDHSDHLNHLEYLERSDHMDHLDHLDRLEYADRSEHPESDTIPGKDSSLSASFGNPYAGKNPGDPSVLSAPRTIKMRVEKNSGDDHTGAETEEDFAAGDHVTLNSPLYADEEGIGKNRRATEKTERIVLVNKKARSPYYFEHGRWDGQSSLTKIMPREKKAAEVFHRGDYVIVNGTLYASDRGSFKKAVVREYKARITMINPRSLFPYYIDAAGWTNAASLKRQFPPK